MAKEKITISDAQLKKELFKLFNSGNTDKGKCREVLGIKYKIQVQRFYKSFNLALADWQKIQEKAQAEQTTENTKEGLKSGLKSKIERQLELQAMLEPDYRVEEIVGTDVKSGKVIRAMRVLNPMERKHIHAELSKMAGDYAPSKIAETDPEGNEKKITSKDIANIKDIVKGLNGKS